MGNGAMALNSTGAQGAINNTSGLSTGTQSTYNPLTLASPGKLPLPSAGFGSNNLLAPNSVNPQFGSNQPFTYGQKPQPNPGQQPPPWNAFPSGSYTYGFVTNWPAIPGGIYKGQDAYLPPTSTASVDLNIVDNSGTLYPLPSYNFYNIDGTLINLSQSVAEATSFLDGEFGISISF
jgi:hypothetical protein